MHEESELPFALKSAVFLARQWTMSLSNRKALFSYTEVCPVEHAERSQKMICDAMLVAQSYKCPDRDPSAVDL